MRFEENAIVAAPVSDVFAYVARPDQLPDYFAGMLAVQDVETRETRACRFGYRFAHVRGDH